MEKEGKFPSHTFAFSINDEDMGAIDDAEIKRKIDIYCQEYRIVRSRQETGGVVIQMGPIPRKQAI